MDGTYRVPGRIALLGVAAVAGLVPVDDVRAQSYLMSRMAQLPEYSSGNSDAVRIYGTVDLGTMYTKTDNAGGRWQMQSGGVQTSKIGFYAAEDLGAGWKAEMKLEAGFNADNGVQQASALFNRESWVSLRSSTWGTVRLGNQINAMLPLYIDPFGLVTTNSVYAWVAGGVVQSATGVGYNTDLGPGSSTIPVRVPKSLTYATPRVAGLAAQVIHATSTAGTTNPKTTTQGGVVSYIAGPVYVAASLIQAWSAPGTVTAGQPARPVRTDIPSAGVIYDTGNLVLSASHARIKPRTEQSGEAKLTSLGVIVPDGRMTYRASAVYRDTVDARDSAGRFVASSALGLMLGAEYDLSRRTTVYLRAGSVRNFGASTIVLNSVALPLVQGSTAPQTGIETRTFSAGLFHNF